jgi:hypothetical protein
MNLNLLAQKVAEKEGKKRQINIAQIKEVMKILLTELAGMDEAEALKVIRRHRK